MMPSTTNRILTSLMMSIAAMAAVVPALGPASDQEGESYLPEFPEVRPIGLQEG